MPDDTNQCIVPTMAVAPHRPIQERQSKTFYARRSVTIVGDDDAADPRKQNAAAHTSISPTRLNLKSVERVRSAGFPRASGEGGFGPPSEKKSSAASGRRE